LSVVKFRYIVIYQICDVKKVKERNIMSRIEKIVFGLGLLSSASTAFAGEIRPVPAPIAGLGIGAVLLVGVGYRALKSRIGR